MRTKSIALDASERGLHTQVITQYPNGSKGNVLLRLWNSDLRHLNTASRCVRIGCFRYNRRIPGPIDIPLWTFTVRAYREKYNKQQQRCVNIRKQPAATSNSISSIVSTESFGTVIFIFSLQREIVVEHQYSLFQYSTEFCAVFTMKSRQERVILGSIFSSFPSVPASEATFH